ncbi:MAG: DUF2520 domain-containing protein [Calditrichaeota bacterium]|nr:DUF2520 domain-containing protein [Calditrichota bacterium]
MDIYSIGLIGPGRLGKALLRALHQAGQSVTLVVGRTQESLKSLQKEFPDSHFTTDFRNWPPVDILLVTVPDDSIERVTDQLAASPVNLRSVIVAHTSGAKSSEVLAPLREKGALLASIHPAQSFAGTPDDAQKFRGCTFAIEGDSQAAIVLADLATALGGIPFKIPTQAKPLYHLACVMVSNYSTALMDSGLAILEQIGISRPKGKTILLPLFQTAAQNLDGANPEDILTGPIARGDVETVRNHLENLKNKNPQRLPVYISLGRETLNLAQKLAPNLSQKFQAIENLFESYEK